jgi:hypothetical protein
MNHQASQGKKKKVVLNFVEKEYDRIIYREYLLPEWTRMTALPEGIRRNRNLNVVLAFVAIAMAILAFGMYAYKRSKTTLVFDIITIVIVILGTLGNMQLSWKKMLISAFWSIAFIGPFYIYLVIDALFIDTANADEKASGALTDTQILMFLSIPDLFIFIYGVSQLSLVFKIFDEIKFRDDPQYV